MKWFGLLAAGLLWGAVIPLLNIADERAAYWRPVIERIARQSGSGPVKSERVMLLKGCGWSLGETVYGEMTIDGVPADFLMCRSRHGVRFDLTTHESHWILGAAR